MDMDDILFQMENDMTQLNSEPKARIPVDRLIDTLDRHFARNDLAGAGRLFSYWHREAETLGDREGLLTVLNEEMGFYRRTGDCAAALAAVEAGLSLIAQLGREDMLSSATVYLNAATTLKAFGKAGDALPLYERAERIYEKKLSPTDALFGGLYNNRALAYADLGRYADAEASYRAALCVMERVPHGEPEVAVTYVNMAHLFEAEGKPAADIADCMERAAKKLLSPAMRHDANFAFVASKCYPSFAHFGYAETAERLREVSERIYAGT